MEDAGGQLGEGDPDSAVDSQGKALDDLRRGAQRLAQQMQEMGDAEDAGGNRSGRKQANDPERTDPLGRSMRASDFDQTVKIPGEIDVQRARRILEELRKRLGEANRPQVELDYLERLLKDY